MLSLLNPNNILFLSGIGFAGNELLWLAAGLSAIALVSSLVALSRAKRSLAAAQNAPSGQTQSVAPAVPAARPAAAAGSNVNDPVLIAVLTAAVAMMLADSSQSPADSRQVAARPSGTPAIAGPVSVAGFTIRKVRRV